jgi:hypothetical protein
VELGTEPEVNRQKLNQSCPAVVYIETAGRQAMCQSCVEIDKQVERHRESLRSMALTKSEAERINQLIVKLYADRVRLHRSEEP